MVRILVRIQSQSEVNLSLYTNAKLKTRFIMNYNEAQSINDESVLPYDVHAPGVPCPARVRYSIHVFPQPSCIIATV